MTSCVTTSNLTQLTAVLGQTVNVTFPGNAEYSKVVITVGLDVAPPYFCMDVPNATIVDNTYTWVVDKDPEWFTPRGNLFETNQTVAFAAMYANGSGFDASAEYRVLSKDSGAFPKLTSSRSALLGLLFIGAASLLCTSSVL